MSTTSVDRNPSTARFETGATNESNQSAYSEIDFGPRQPFGRLVRIELRKMVDTRSGRWLLVGIVALSVIALTWAVTHLPSGPVAFTDMLDSALIPADLILPVIGILAMTSEWTQRTALTTFTLSPRRIPVLFAKLLAAITLALSVVTVIVGMAFAATALGGVVGGDGATYSHALRNIAGSGLSDVLNVVMAAGFGLVATVTAVAVLAFYVAPTAWALIAPSLLHRHSTWLDVFNSFDRISSFNLHGEVAQTVTSIGAWVVLPAVIGLLLANRREVK